MTRTTKTKAKKAKRPPDLNDPAIVAAKEAAETKAAWLALPEDDSPEYKAAEKRVKEADDAFSAAPVTSLAGALVKLRALLKDIVEDEGVSWGAQHVKTVAAFLEGFAGAPQAAVAKPDHPDAALVIDDPTIAAGEEAEAAHTAWLALPHATPEDEQTPEFEAAEKRWHKAEEDFAAMPIASIAGMFVKLRALVKLIQEDSPWGKFPLEDPTWETGHVETLSTFLDGFIGVPSIVADDHPDAALVALGRELVEARAEEERAMHKANAALEAFNTATDRPEVPAQVEIKYRTGGGYTTSELKSVEAIQGFREHVLGDCIDPPEVVTARLDAGLAEWRKYEAEDKRVSDRVGLTERWAEQDAASGRVNRIEHQIIDTRPETAVGLVVLVKLLARYTVRDPNFTDESNGALAQNIQATLERLTPGLAEIGWGPSIVIDPAVAALAEYKVAKAADDAISNEDAEAETPEYQATGDRLYAARDVVYDAVPTSMAGMAAKIRFLFDHGERGNDLWPLFDTMAKSMMPFLEGGVAAAPDPVVTLFAEWGAITEEVMVLSAAIPEDCGKGGMVPGRSWVKEGEIPWDAALARRDAVEGQIMLTPATSMQGVAVKIRIASHYIFEAGDFDQQYATPSRDIDYVEGNGGPLSADQSYAISALRDAERLAAAS